MAVFRNGWSRVGPWVATDAVMSGSGSASLTTDPRNRIEEGVSA